MTERESRSKGATASHKTDAACSSCVDLLKAVLEDPASRPHQLLQSMVQNMTIRSVPNGVQVPMPSKKQKQWWFPATVMETDPVVSTDDEPQPASSDTPLSLSNLVQATSSTLTQQQQQDNNNNNNWLTLTCRACGHSGPEGNARAFVMGPTPLSIVVCTNRFQHSKQQMSEILTHELVHVHDVQQLQLELQRCEDLAYSEVRAAREAECYNKKNRKDDCVRTKAWTATRNLFGAQAWGCVQTVYEEAMRDKRPFEGKHEESSSAQSGR